MKTLDQLLKSGKLLLLRENGGFICGAVVEIEEGCISPLRVFASQIDSMEKCQEFAGQTVEQAIEAAAQLEGLPY